MPHLMIDLGSTQDCERGLNILRRRLGRQGQAAGDWATDCDQASGGPKLAELPLPQRLKRIQSRGMWKHLVKIAQSAPDPLSLPELDSLLDLPKNKMRSLKAIMAKLENRFGLKFLKVDANAGVDAAGNPRYIMMPNVRRQILRLAANE